MLMTSIGQSSHIFEIKNSPINRQLQNAEKMKNRAVFWKYLLKSLKIWKNLPMKSAKNENIFIEMAKNRPKKWNIAHDRSYSEKSFKIAKKLKNLPIKSAKNTKKIENIFFSKSPKIVK